MQVQKSVNKVVAINAGKEHVARIKESPKAFHILSGALYSDKILAVVRELSCNAYDAHVAAGKADIPFEVKLPSSFDATFYVKDYGTGISEENIYSMYMTYFDSTKQDSNDFIGQLGLGSKSPFSYGATFTVESRQNGVKKIYTCYKNADLCPAVTKMGEGSTDEPNGLTVSLSVKNEDIYKFKESAKYALAYIKVKPTVVGVSDFVIPTVDYKIEGTDWKLRSNQNLYNGPRVIQGSVSYPIDMNLVGEATGDQNVVNMLYYMKSTPLDLFVHIGDVEVAPSREALTYDKRTATNLLKVLTNVYEEVFNNIQADLNNIDNWWNAVVFYDEVRYGEGRSFFHMFSSQNKEFTYNGESLQSRKILSKRIDTTDWLPKSFTIQHIEGTYFVSKKLTYITSYNFQKVLTSYGGMTINPRKETVYILDEEDNQKLTSSRLKHYLWRKNDDSSHEIGMLIQPAEGFTKVDQKELKKFLELAGSPPMIKLMDIPTPPKSESTYKYTPKSKDMLPVWQGFQERDYHSSNKFGKLEWETEQFDLEDGGFYVDLDRYRIVSSKIRVERFDDFISCALHLGIMDGAGAPVIVGLTDKQCISAKKEGRWINFIDYVIDQLNLLNANGEMDDLQMSAALVSATSRNPSLHLVHTNWRYLQPIVNNTEVVQWMNDVNKAQRLDVSKYTKFSSAASMVVGNLVKYEQKDAYSLSNSIESKWNELLAKNPKIQCLDLEECVKLIVGRQLIADFINEIK